MRLQLLGSVLNAGQHRGTDVSENEHPYVQAATGVRSVEVIDGGDTLAVRLHTAAGGETCLLLPMGAVGDLLFQIAGALDVGTDQAHRPSE